MVRCVVNIIKIPFSLRCKAVLIDSSVFRYTCPVLSIYSQVVICSGTLGLCTVYNQVQYGFYN